MSKKCQATEWIPLRLTRSLIIRFPSSAPLFTEPNIYPVNLCKERANIGNTQFSLTVNRPVCESDWGWVSTTIPLVETERTLRKWYPRRNPKEKDNKPMNAVPKIWRDRENSVEKISERNQQCIPGGTICQTHLKELNAMPSYCCYIYILRNSKRLMSW